MGARGGVALAELYGVPLDEILNGPKAQEENPPKDEPTKKELKEMKLAGMSKRQKAGRKMVKFPFPILIAAAYLLLGFMNGNWHPGWIILLLIPVYYCVGGALCCRTKKAMLLTMPIHLVLVAVYLLFGFTAGMWHPQWLIFLIIPLYYWIISVFYKEKKNKS